MISHFSFSAHGADHLPDRDLSGSRRRVEREEGEIVSTLSGGRHIFDETVRRCKEHRPNLVGSAEA
jgi:hypothetical protein